MRAPINKLFAASKRFTPTTNIFEMAELAKGVLSCCNNMGEGWLLTAEMVELIEGGTPNIVCCSPFACLPNHVVGQGNDPGAAHASYPESNIVAVDYDPGCLRGQPAQPHQAHDQRGQGEL